MTFEEYVSRVLEVYEIRTNWRIGQCHANTLQSVRVDLAWVVPDDLDPFYSDVRVSAYLEWLKGIW